MHRYIAGTRTKGHQVSFVVIAFVQSDSEPFGGTRTIEASPTENRATLEPHEFRGQRCHHAQTVEEDIQQYDRQEEQLGNGHDQHKVEKVGRRRARVESRRSEVR